MSFSGEYNLTADVPLLLCTALSDLWDPEDWHWVRPDIWAHPPTWWTRGKTVRHGSPPQLLPCVNVCFWGTIIWWCCLRRNKMISQCISVISLTLCYQGPSNHHQRTYEYMLGVNTRILAACGPSHAHWFQLHVTVTSNTTLRHLPCLVTFTYCSDDYWMLQQLTDNVTVPLTGTHSRPADQIL